MLICGGGGELMKGVNFFKISQKILDFILSTGVFRFTILIGETKTSQTSGIFKCFIK